MFDVLQSSYPLRASIAVILALVAVALLCGGVYGLIRLASPRGRTSDRPDPTQGPQENLDLHRERDAG